MKSISSGGHVEVPFVHYDCQVSPTERSFFSEVTKAVVWSAARVGAGARRGSIRRTDTRSSRSGSAALW